MRRFTIPLLLAAALILSPAAAFAQDQDRPNWDHGAPAMAHLEDLQDELNLNDLQREELVRIFEALRAENAALMTKMRESGASRERQSEGRERAGDFRKRTRERGERSRKQARERLEELSPEEREELRARWEERRKRLEQMSPEERQELRGRRGTRGSRGAAHELMRKMRSNMAEAIQEARDVLTDEQEEQLRELISEHHPDASRRGAHRRGHRQHRTR